MFLSKKRNTRLNPYTEGWGTGSAKGRRLGKGQGARDVSARKRLRERLDGQRKAATSAAPDDLCQGQAAAEAGVGGKRKRVGGGGGSGLNGKAPRADKTAAAAAAAVDDASAAETAEDEEAAAAKVEEDLRPDAERYACATCDVKCGSKANFGNHCDSKKHKAAKQREKGKAILDGIRAGNSSSQ
jgi:hypothetical protein